MVTYYRSYHIINGKGKTIVIDDDYNMILDPTTEQIKMSISGDPPRKCCICRRTVTYIYPGGKFYWHGHKCDKKDCTGKICHECFKKLERDKTFAIREMRFKERKERKETCCVCGGTYTAKNFNGVPIWLNHKCEKIYCTEYICTICYNKISHRLPHGELSINSQWRNDKLVKNSEKGKGLIGEVIIAKVRKLEVLCIEMDNFNYKFDLSYDIEYGMIQSKFKAPYYGDWDIGFGMEHDFNTLFAICANKDLSCIGRVYAIPDIELYGIHSIYLAGNPHPSIGCKYDKFKIDPKPYNYAYQNLMLYLQDKKFINVNDIKKWLLTDKYI